MSGARSSQDILGCSLPSELNMTTAVQPSELVFEFASNGMDEINQVGITLEKPHALPFLGLHRKPKVERANLSAPPLA